MNGKDIFTKMELLRRWNDSVSRTWQRLTIISCSLNTCVYSCGQMLHSTLIRVVFLCNDSKCGDAGLLKEHRKSDHWVLKPKQNIYSIPSKTSWNIVEGRRENVKATRKIGEKFVMNCCLMDITASAIMIE